MNPDSNDITIIPHNLRIQISNSSNNDDHYRNLFNWKDLYRIQSQGVYGWLSCSIINSINIMQMKKYKLKYNISNNQNLPFFIFPSYEILDNDNQFHSSLNCLEKRIIRQFKFNIFSGIKSHLFFPINHNNTHWTLCIVSILKRIIYFGDSYFTFDTTLSKRRAISTFSKVKQFLSKYANSTVLSDSDVIFSNILEYQVVELEEDFPQQINGYDCGVFGLTFIDSLLNENYYFAQSNMENIRKNLLAFAVLGEMYK